MGYQPHSTGWAARRLTEAGIEVKRRDNNLTPAEIRRLESLRRDGVSWKLCAQILKRKYMTLYVWWWRHKDATNIAGAR
jgi:hypothetical protein